MAEDEDVEVAELVDDEGQESPRFRDALFGVRSMADLKDLVSNPDYNPHIHIMLLLTICYIVGIVSLALGA